MKSLKRFYVVCLASIVSLCLSRMAWSVVILESTYKQYGFKPAEALALEPQFSSLIYLDSESSCGSGSWIGNYKGHGYVLTAGHMFTKESNASDYSYVAIDGTEYQGEEVFLHPFWNDNLEDRSGYDFAIVRLSEEVEDVGPQPYLYNGSNEQGKTLTFIGYGYRGAAKKGEDDSIDTKDEPAAAEGLVEEVNTAVDPVPKKGDAGNYLAIWLPKEDGSISNPINDKGITKPISPLAGILGSGDSGGPAWIQTDNGWAIAAINSNGNENAAYGNSSWFPRISHVEKWIKSIVPTAEFID